MLLTTLAAAENIEISGQLVEIRLTTIGIVAAQREGECIVRKYSVAINAGADSGPGGGAR